MDQVTVITDVPQSGVYYQLGAIVSIVVQLIDQQTGLPIQLQTATGMTISLLYPDGVTSQTFTASLYSDGSDGNIVYTTRNVMSTVDLSQNGLYQMQGSATVNGVQLPPSYATDFYVLKNVSGLPTPPIFNSTGLVMFDSSSIRWVVTVNTSGDFVFTQQSFGPADFLYFNTLVLQDTDGVYWTVTMNTNGTFKTVAGGSFTHALPSIILTDSSNTSWVVTVTTAGVLIAS
jgi:hypothetical protein